MTDRIDVFSMHMVRQRKDLRDEALQAIERYTSGVGWHYLLDFIWLLERADTFAPNSLILDAGAGNGLIQLLLALRGHRVLSVDFAARVPVRAYAEAVPVTHIGGASFSGDYIRHQGYDDSAAASTTTLPTRVDIDAVFAEGARIVYWQADLSDLGLLEDASVDQVVSVSALEHNAREGMQTCIAELERVLAPNGSLNVTISGSLKEDWFHEPSHGWCLSEETVRRVFGLQEYVTNWADAEELFTALSEGTGLKEHLAGFYFTSGNNGMPWGKWAPEYFPLGVVKCKR